MGRLLRETKETHLRDQFYAIALPHRVLNGMDEGKHLDGARPSPVDDEVRMQLGNLRGTAARFFSPTFSIRRPTDSRSGLRKDASARRHRKRLRFCDGEKARSPF